MQKSYLHLLGFIIIFFIACKKNEPLPSEKTITSFVFKTSINNLTADVEGTIANDTIYVKLPATAAIHQLIPSISFKGKNINPADSTAQDFSSPFHYTVSAEDGSTHVYTVMASYFSSIKTITSFKFTQVLNNGLSADVDGTISGDTITLMLPVGLNTDKLVPSIIYEGKSINPLDKNEFSFSTPATYTVTAEDGTTKSYIVLVSANQSVFIGIGNYLYCLSAANGIVKWKYNIGHPVTPAAYHDGVVFTGGNADYLYAVNAATGTLKWKETNRLGTHSMCTIKNGIVYCSLNNSLSNEYIYAVDEATGSFKWEYKLLGCSYCSLGNPTEANSTLFVINGGSRAYAFDAISGSLKWKSAATVDLSSANPLVIGDELYYSDISHLLVALDTKTGNENWSFSKGYISGQSSTADDSVIYIPGLYNHLNYIFGVNRFTHELTFQSDAYTSVFTSPYVNDDLVCAYNTGAGIIGINKHTGSTTWNTTGSTSIFSNVVVANGTLYTCKADNNFYAYDAGTGILKWIFRGNEIINSDPCIIDNAGNVYYTSNSGDHN